MGAETTREAVRRLAVEEPTLNLSGIAQRIGVSRERVRQIVEEEQLAVPKGTIGYRPRKQRNAPPTSRVLTGGVAVSISHTVAGTIAELLVAADLSARGFVVFYPLVRTALCDLVAMQRDGELKRIEVRCGHRKGTRILFSTKTKSPAEHHAVVITGEPVIYRPPLE